MSTLKNYNIAHTLTAMAEKAPYRCAIVFPAGRDPKGRAKYIQLSFQQLDHECNQYASGLSQYGIKTGDRVLLMIRPSIELIAVVFALVSLGAVPALIDPGMGTKAFLQCVKDTQPTSLIGIPLSHFLTRAFPGVFNTLKHRISVGRFPGLAEVTLDQIKQAGCSDMPSSQTTENSEAAITFTSGSTGIPKGVVYTHGMFAAVLDLLREEIGIQEGEIDLPGLYIFALLNPALGVTTILPDMDPTKPAKVNPAYFVEAIQTHGVTTSFGSPTIWKRVSSYCLENHITLPSIKRILMAGAPVSPRLIENMVKILPFGKVYTPFGATEALPISNIEGKEILSETATLSDQGKGTCVGRVTKGNQIRVIRISDDPISHWNDNLVLPNGEVGEIVVKGPVVTKTYLNRPGQTALAKIEDVDGIWHRMGDLGYFDDAQRLWFCCRKSHRIETTWGLMLPDPCEAIFNQHPSVSRTALVGVTIEAGKPQIPVLIVEPLPGKMPKDRSAREKLIEELLLLGSKHPQTQMIKTVLFHPSFPVDIRHNAKIQRERLSVWAKKKLKRKLEV